MKLSKISLGISLSILATSPAIAGQDPTATVDVFSTVEQVCNIGVVFGGATEAGVGGSNVGSDEVLGEINDVTGDKTQTLTGFASCNSPGGFKVLAKLDKGALKNTVDEQFYIGYTLENTSTGLTPPSPIDLPTKSSGGVYGTDEFVVGTSTASMNAKQFQLKMTDFNIDNGGIAGSYAEKVTYRLIAM